MDVNPDKYRQKVLSHLRLHRPKEVSRLRAAGELGQRVESLAEQIADWVNSQLDGKQERLAKMGIEERERVQTSEQMMFESDALREIFPMDEKTEREIGPSGAYEG